MTGYSIRRMTPLAKKNRSSRVSTKTLNFEPELETRQAVNKYQNRRKSGKEIHDEKSGINRYFSSGSNKTIYKTIKISGVGAINILLIYLR
jgi:hypothetical protein